MTQQIRLFDLFAKAREPENAQSLNGQEFPDRPQDFVARGSRGEPIVLISGSGKAAPKAPIELSNLSVEFAIPMHVGIGSSGIDGIFTLLSANPKRPDLYEGFCDTVQAVFREMVLNPTVDDVAGTIQLIVELFRATEESGKKTIVGLWGELALIDACSDPEAAVVAWHSTPSDRFDFTFSTHSIEVKATQGAQRVHEFSHEQLVDSGIKPVFVVSLTLRRSAAGISCQEIQESISNRLKNRESRLKLLRLVHQSLGHSYQEALDIRFDFEESVSQARRIQTTLLPTVNIPFASGISNVRYQINFEQAEIARKLETAVKSNLLLL